MPTSEQYRSFLSYFYPLFLILSLTSQTFIFYIITYHTPKYLQTLKMILYNTCFFQIVHVSVCCFLQLRQVSNLVPIQIWSYGHGRYIEAYIGYSLYHVLQAATVISGISVVMTLYLKYEAARRIKLKSWKRAAILFCFLFPLFLSVSMEVILVITQSLPSEIREKYRILNENVEDHSVVGMMDLKTLPSQVNLGVMSSSVVLLPIVGLTSRRKILKHLANTADRFSQAKNAQNRIFVKGLTLQTFLPLFFYVPISSIYFFAIIFHTEILFQQYFMFLIPAFPALFDPYITLYFVTPYRNRVKSWLKMEKSSISSMTVVASSINNY